MSNSFAVGEYVYLVSVVTGYAHLVSGVKPREYVKVAKIDRVDDDGEVRGYTAGKSFAANEKGRVIFWKTGDETGEYLERIPDGVEADISSPNFFR